MANSTYSFQDVKANLVGPTGLIDFSAGAGIAAEGITIAMANDKNTMTIGADGTGMHNLKGDKSGQITVRVLKTAALNAKLNAAYNAQTVTSALHGGNVITVLNPVSGDTTTARGCAFKRAPQLVYAAEGAMNEWVFDCIRIDTLLGKLTDIF